MTVVIGLTGSIGMGKTTTAAMLRFLGVPIHDADAQVHALMGRGGLAVGPVSAAFPETVRDGEIDRGALGARVFTDGASLRRLEAILHPMVAQRIGRFLTRCRRRRAPVVVLDVPLLLEGSGHRHCDLVAVVSAPAFLQRQRVLARPGMTADRLDAILAKQMPDTEKRCRADVVIPTGLGRAVAMRHVRRLINRARRGDTTGCGKSCWIRRRRAWTRTRATGSSRSAASSS